MGPAQRGFSLVEMVMVIVITGIVAAITAAFVQKPLQAYFETSERAALSDVADLALRKMQRDIRRALPNSVRTTSTGGNVYLELIPTLAAGRYENGAPTDGCFTGSCTGMTALGNVIANAHDYSGRSLVIANSSNNSPPGCASPSVYCGDNSAVIQDSSPSGTASLQKGNITFISAAHFGGATAGRRFHIVEGPVTYECDGTGRRLTRYWGYALQASQPTGFAGASSALLADGVNCSFSYLAQGNYRALAILTLVLARPGSAESVALSHQVAVNNVP